jgi:hypothetical protein
MRRLSLSVMIVLACLLASLDRAWACSLQGLTPHMVDASMQASDHVAPTLPASIPSEVLAANPSMDSGSCSGSDSSCDNLEKIELAADATDDMTPADRIGYRLTLKEGTLPTGLELPAEAVEPSSGKLDLFWFNTNHEAVDFTMNVVAIDLAGNESAPQAVRASDDGPRACAVARPRASGHGLGWVAIVGLLLAARRRRVS